MAGVDDPFASREDAESETIREKVFDWFMADLSTRLLPNSPLFIVATRWHLDDLCGRVEEMSKEGRGIPYEIVNLPALAMEDDPLLRKENEPLWPTFFDYEHLINLKNTLPSRDWNSLYMGSPVDLDGGVLDGDWIQRYDRLPDINNELERQNIRRITLSVDCANKDTERSDYTVITVWYELKNGTHYLIDVIRKRVEFQEMCVLVDKTARRYAATAILVEDKAAGTQYIQVKKGNAPAPVVPISTNNQSKQFRFDAVTPMFEAGEVFFPRKAPWLADLEKELFDFPSGKYDDQVDSTSQYLSWARKIFKGGTKKLQGLGSKKGTDKVRQQIGDHMAVLAEQHRQKRLALGLDE